MRKTKTFLITTTTVIGLSAAASAFANGGTFYQPPPPPADNGGWSLTLGGQLQRPTDSDLSNTTYAVSGSQGASGNNFTNNATFHKLKPKYLWGGYAELAYRFPQSPYGVALSADGIFGSKSNSITVDPTQNGGFGLNVPFFTAPNTIPVNGLPINPANVTLTSATAKLKTDFFNVDLVGRQHINPGYNVELIPYAGVRFTYLNEKYTLNTSGKSVVADPATGFISNGVYNGNLTYKTKFWGIGPIVGTKLNFPIVGGLSLFGDLHGALLMGETDNSISATGNTTTTQIIGGAVTNYADSANYPGDRNTRFVPNVGGKLGLEYVAKFDNGMSFGVQGGWGGDFYYHMVDNRALKQFDAGVNGPGGLLFPNTAGGENLSKFSNFTSVGPFFGIKITG